MGLRPRAVIVYQPTSDTPIRPFLTCENAVSPSIPNSSRRLPRCRGAASHLPQIRPLLQASSADMPSDSEGIAALFSMYNDDDEEEEEADEPKPPSPAPPTAAAPDPAGVSSAPPSPAGGEAPNPSQVPPSPPLTEESGGRKTLASASPALPPLPSRRSSSPFAVSSPSPLRPPSTAPPADLPRPPRRGALAIVDYAHDEMAMSPEQEVELVKYVFTAAVQNLLVFWIDVVSCSLQDGEIMNGTHRFGSDVQAAEGKFQIGHAF